MTQNEGFPKDYHPRLTQTLRMNDKWSKPGTARVVTDV
ncbi:hypothetical protein COLO4_31992 [Corchorus olitorius]|uniref:Uncharacterized protein n=1 Tax=Corchorus olitorius TaxID=93759 RepID=A0A1R3H2M2_9ROSI|nr:hypothetical protein COLO4_31992 [Corchorus olitorius]